MNFYRQCPGLAALTKHAVSRAPHSYNMTTETVSNEKDGGDPAADRLRQLCLVIGSLVAELSPEGRPPITFADIKTRIEAQGMLDSIAGDACDPWEEVARLYERLRGRRHADGKGRPYVLGARFLSGEACRVRFLLTPPQESNFIQEMKPSMIANIDTPISPAGAGSSPSDPPYEWWVVSPSHEQRWIKLRCEKTGKTGWVRDPSKSEWGAAFTAHLKPYRWHDDTRVVMDD